MGMSTNVIGFIPPDDKFEEMKAIWDSCKKAKIDPPDEVSDFFNDVEPDASGIEKDIPVHPWNDKYNQGYEVKVDEIPKDVKVIRFYNSW